MVEKSDYERQRDERIARNAEQLRSLNVPSLQPEPSKVMLASRGAVIFRVTRPLHETALSCHRSEAKESFDRQ